MSDVTTYALLSGTDPQVTNKMVKNSIITVLVRSSFSRAGLKKTQYKGIGQVTLRSKARTSETFKCSRGYVSESCFFTHIVYV